MNAAGDYSAAYAILKTDSEFQGHGMVRCPCAFCLFLFSLEFSVLNERMSIYPHIVQSLAPQAQMFFWGHYEKGKNTYCLE